MTAVKFRKRARTPELRACVTCAREHPNSLFPVSAGGRAGDECAFCVDAREKEAVASRKQAVAVEDAALKNEAVRQTRKRDTAREALRARREKEKVVAKKHTKAVAEAIEPDPESQREALKVELAKRELARRHLLPFVRRFNDKYDAGWVHKDLCQRLEQFSLDVAEGKGPRLMISMPPRSGKSELVNRNYPAWHLGRYPHHEFITCSYAADLALGFSRKVREILVSAEYKRLFPEVSLKKDSQRVDQWTTTQDGGLVAAGVGGPLTGRGAHVLVIDDPVKNREEADSEASRRTIKDWYTSTAYTRLAPGGGVLVMMTRWHDDDLAGWLRTQAAKGEGDDWEVVEYPAVATFDETYRRKGEALHPERFPLEMLERIKRAVGDRDWAALYQQNPVAEDGEFFTRDMFVTYGMDELPEYHSMSYYTAWDLAIGQREHNDESFGVTVGVDQNQRMWVVDIRHGRWDSEEIVDQILTTYEVWKADVTGIERGHIEMAIGPFLEMEIKARGLSAMYIEPLKPGRRDKQSRARPIQALMKRRQVVFRGGCDEAQYLRNQMMRFPSGVHDDGVDAMAWLGQMIQGMVSVQPERDKPKKSWRDRLGRLGREHRGAIGHMGA